MVKVEVTSVETQALRILVVDDDEDACDILTQVLKHLGHIPDCVQDSVEGLQRVLSGRYDVLLLDLVMPGLSGFDLLRAARTRTDRPTSVIAVSSFSEFRHKAAEVGFNAFIEKPVELSKLRPLLASLLPGT
jgi:two-component system response regulator CpxR